MPAVENKQFSYPSVTFIAQVHSRSTQGTVQGLLTPFQNKVTKASGDVGLLPMCFCMTYTLGSRSSRGRRYASAV